MEVNKLVTYWQGYTRDFSPRGILYESPRVTPHFLHQKNLTFLVIIFLSVTITSQFSVLIGKLSSDKSCFLLRFNPCTFSFFVFKSCF